MNITGFSYSMIFLLIISAVACARSDINKSYRNLANRVSNESKSSATNARLGRFGEIDVDKDSFLYFESNRLTVDAGELESLSSSTRRLLIKKLLLRKMIIRTGMEEDIYNSPQAARYILPRMEKVLEDYYFFHKGNFPGIKKKLRRITPDDVLFHEMEKKGGRGKSTRHLDSETLIREKDRILETLARRRMMEKRKEIIGNLLKDNPPMELY